MANEADIRMSLQIVSDEFKHRTFTTDFRSDVTGKKGPSPGGFQASVAGTTVDFSELVTPTWCEIRNYDETNFVTIGIWDGTEFYPLLEVMPETHQVLRLSRLLGRSLDTGTGTGTFDTGTYQLMVKADTAACSVYVGAFER